MVSPQKSVLVAAAFELQIAQGTRRRRNCQGTDGWRKGLRSSFWIIHGRGNKFGEVGSLSLSRSHNSKTNQQHMQGNFAVPHRDRRAICKFAV